MKDHAIANEPTQAPGVGQTGDVKSLLDDDDDRILTDDELDVLTGISKTTRWRERKAGRFPRLLELSPGRKGNSLGQLREWHGQRRAAAKACAEIIDSEPPGRGRPRKKAAARAAM
ncbi:helix-turn-helix transcriptional regulator [Rhizobium mulingense]|uniref:helix-turn-helix transcriptional regulator n=1 Tax=Rhizobium mulingense TaxID=3031128 RepID=UPI002B47FA2A|nr:hypothetical protein [Rhizobium sp. MJ21]MEB3047042.1 hypothetical protein [Rhizobium sp. MJ21]